MSLEEARAVVSDHVKRLRSEVEGPVLVAIDGPSGAGKTTLAESLAHELAAAHVLGDDFYSADVSDAVWDSLSAVERASRVIDWQRLRVEVLEPLLAEKIARWHSIDFEAGPRSDGTYPLQAAITELHPNAVIMLDGAYSSRPELADLISLNVLVEIPEAERRTRLTAREEAEFLSTWHARWDPTEAYYFTEVRPRSYFDAVVSV